MTDAGDGPVGLVLVRAPQAPLSPDSTMPRLGIAASGVPMPMATAAMAAAMLCLATTGHRERVRTRRPGRRLPAPVARETSHD